MIRFWNSEVNENPEGVAEAILQLPPSASAAPTPSPSLPGRGGKAAAFRVTPSLKKREKTHPGASAASRRPRQTLRAWTVSGTSWTRSSWTPCSAALSARASEPARRCVGRRLAGQRADHPLAARAEHDRAAEAVEQREAVQQVEIVLDGLAEADAGIDEDLRAVDARPPPPPRSAPRASHRRRAATGRRSAAPPASSRDRPDGASARPGSRRRRPPPRARSS